LRWNLSPNRWTAKESRLKAHALKCITFGLLGIQEEMAAQTEVMREQLA